MSTPRKKIALIILGGTVLIEDSPEKNAVITGRDVTPWLNKIPEVNIIAEVEPFFILGEKETEVNIDHWIKAGKIVANHIREFDGFIVAHHTSSLLYGACAFSFMLQNLPKPVVFTGSQIPVNLGQEANKKLFKKYKGLGIKANLINAIQVASHGPAEVSIIFGNKLVRANQAIKEKGLNINLFDAPAPAVLGNIDFGIKIEDQNIKKARVPFAFKPDFEKKVSVVSLYQEESSDLLEWVTNKKPKGLVIQMQQSSLSQSQIKKITELQKSIALVVHTTNPFIKKERPNLLIVDYMTPEATLMKFMWALGRTKNMKEIKKILEQGIAKEIGEEA
ncbi:MAG: hypothetical protein COY66_03770 [Candidatus Kerfeldbacteria bacterium CG_4_10_14_0_8_um_filter_42_10]|uniref:L-asparaginase N-terminal domain-containing protein n=1 Tax=Candidatus Kerfeldbacteria bacterium CG_4_10_14_0_8_um_filter_42_10 TaxID=2014248 RepID=A0A2M7RIT1_9BACT|nr:MAG: hypothetical protein COY66_03770 [Candidatus Kerfeldbacteria bacterium CG_4_10_14_0_8_um_filter_42_10]